MNVNERPPTVGRCDTHIRPCPWCPRLKRRGLPLSLCAWCTTHGAFSLGNAKKPKTLYGGRWVLAPEAFVQ